MDLFYEFINEASTGRVDCGMYFNILFNTKIEEEIITSNSNFLTPTLIIKNKDKFFNLLNNYLDIASIFYSDKKLDVNNYRKMLLATLFSNACNNDFNNIEAYLKLRTNFMLDKTLKPTSFYSDILKCDVIIQIDRNYPYEETPYSVNICLKDNEQIYNMPSIKLGIDSDVCYIYALQNKKQEQTDFTKKINRKLYKINKDVVDSDILDVTMSFVLTLSILFGYLNKLNINKFIVIPFLIERWNAKKIMFMIKEKYNISTLQEEQKQELIQENITDKFIRTFRRIEYHFNNINIISYSFDTSEYMYILNNNNFSCNNELLSEMYNLGEIYEKNRNSL